MRNLIHGFALLIASAGLTVNSTSFAADAWRYKVLLDGDDIGYHNFVLSDSGDTQTAKIEAEFKVTVLLVTAYAYSHSNTEIWKGNCLQKINSITNDDGDSFYVDGALENGHFVVESKAGTLSHPECIMTFSYWKPEFLKQNKLLNSQTGEYMAVTISNTGQENITVKGRSTAATKYVLSGQGLDDIELWYSADGRWLRLASTTADGYRITYELQ